MMKGSVMNSDYKHATSAKKGHNATLMGWFLCTIFAIVVLVVCCGCSSSGGSTKSSSNEPSDKAVSTEVTEGTPQAQIEKAIRDRIKSKFNNTDIREIRINENAATEAEDDYIVLVDLTWTQKNSGKTSKQMLSMYSEDLAATVGNECPNVQEIAIFWEVPYLSDNAKCAYERKGNGMYEMDMVWGAAFDKN